MTHLEFITKYEAGEAGNDEVVESFQAMIDDGTVWQLQGFYGRAAMELINNGYCTLPDPPTIKAVT